MMIAIKTIARTGNIIIFLLNIFFNIGLTPY